jgi:predicted nuclease of predicted toxin-antitoxin system
VAGVHLVFLLDASSPESVAKVIESAGHKAIRHNDVLAERTSDVVVCETAMKNNAILVAVDTDMKRLTRRFKPESDRFKKLSVVHLGCNAVMASKRMEQALSLIAHEFDVSCRKASSRVWMEITNHHFTTFR